MMLQVQRDSLNKWKMDQTIAKSSEQDIKKKEDEENSKTQNTLNPVAPGAPIVSWRDLERRRQGIPLGYNANSLGYSPQGIPDKKGMKEENK